MQQLSQTINELLTQLNKEQREAVKHTEGPLLVMAGAGSGKTRVLTYRIAYLIQEKFVSPHNILAITFTNKAAREMKQRVHALVGQGSERMLVSTFHSMCVRILRRHIDRIGYDSNFTIIDQTDQVSVMRQVLKDLNIDPKSYHPRAMLAQISTAKNELKTPKQYAEKAHGFYEKQISDIYTAYQKMLSKNEALDFDDLIMQTVVLFKRVPDILTYYQNRFQYIHVDEYQDTNYAQYYLVNQLAKRYKNLCVVGDSDQSIYRWRGADIKNILSFEQDYEHAKVILLEQNYRSTKTILEAANAVIEKNTSRKPKKLWTENDEGEKITYYKGNTERYEALYVVEQIHDLLNDKGYAPSDIAVLYRTNAQSRAIEEALVKSATDYQIVGGTKFYDRKEIKDMIAYLRLLTNPNDDMSFERIVNEPKRGIGATSVERLRAYAMMHDISFSEAVKEVDFTGVTKRAANALANFGEMIESLAKQQEFLSATEMVEQVLEQTGYEKMLLEERTLEAQSRLENLEEFKSVTQEFEKNNAENTSLVHFLTELALIADIDSVDEEDPEAEKKVTLMTLHAAKGLEFPVVFLIGMEENVFPHSRSMTDEIEMEEERRLAYVGITRAEQKLYLTHAAMRTLYGKTNYHTMSRFITEIPEQYIDGLKESAQPRSMTFDEGINADVPKRKSRRISTKRESGAEQMAWQAGDKAKHKMWGVGTVVKTSGQGDDLELDIAFPAPTGIKRLLAKFAPITKE